MLFSFSREGLTHIESTKCAGLSLEGERRFLCDLLFRAEGFSKICLDNLRTYWATRVRCVLRPSRGSALSNAKKVGRNSPFNSEGIKKKTKTLEYKCLEQLR